MMRRRPASSRPLSTSALLLALLVTMILLFVPERAAAEPAPAAVAAFNSYINTVESRIAAQHRSQSAFLVPVDLSEQVELTRGELVIDQLTRQPPPIFPAQCCITGAAPPLPLASKLRTSSGSCETSAPIPSIFPQVLRAKVLSQNGDRLQVVMRVRQKHIITVVMDTAYDVTFGRLDPRHGYSISRSTRIDEIASPGTSSERLLSPSEEHGFLWRLYTYWSYEETDKGLYMQIESVSLTRSIPAGLGWVIGPFVKSVPRESLEFTLRSACDALRKQH